MRAIAGSFFLAVCLGLIHGCASTESQSNADALKAKADSKFDAYLSCMKVAAADYSPSSASPHEVADAAQSKCGATFRELESSLEEQLTYGMVTNVGYSTGLREARKLAQDLRVSGKEKVVQWVIDSRLKKK
jgi:hypothetical protein